mmetsp:Transcript_9862/g.13939  ORF Transcript_9862/g.13939 Transcript_9862/m.13939 type:complete len:2377 (-) Transcript_9862:101-7231(-)
MLVEDPYQPEAVDMVDPDEKSKSLSSFHRRFPTVDAYVTQLGGNKGRVIEKVLIANNGVAAVKAIRSIRKWAYEVFGNERAISFVVMATPEDLRANAEYIRMGDVIADVPGGSNNNNYANVTLIVELARLHGVHAVWAGWGHASENPSLPNALHESKPPIKFIGPAGPPMQALGDKIGSTIIAQNAGVPCISWNGENVVAEYNRETGCLPEESYEQANIHNASEAYEAAKKIGFPVMIKASEGGGGKGIRMVDAAENVQTAYRQVCGEVPGSPIFIMKLSTKSRHLEVQLLADEYGDAVALNGRDCSVQRRHQKIIEEGPPVAAKPKIWTQMEKAAVSLAKAVGYANAGTVEYLYSEPDAKFYFLELNPRLQVEHPVTEMITHVNLPACQLQVAMGIPLQNIPDIRELYGKNRFEDNPKDDSSKIDFDVAERVSPDGHCIAVRITAENAEAGFKPTSGGIQELNFRSTPSVWGYFSMDSSGSIHEFADSQFGHLFANGKDREQARRNMVLALKELSIRGDISTTIDYISQLIELDDFVDNNIDTGWLDVLIKQNVDGIGGAESMLQRRKSDVKSTPLHNHSYVVLGATITAFDMCAEGEKEFLDLLGKGQLPPMSLLSMVRDVELILSGVKYKLKCTRNGRHSFSISLLDDDSTFVQTNVRVLSDGGYLIDIGGKSHVAYLTNKADAGTGMRMNVGGANIVFSPDYDPSSLRTDVAGKLVKKLVPDGTHVKKGEAYGEIEVMKMFMPLKVDEAGEVTWCVNEGAALAAGDLLATLELENPDNVAKVSVFEGDLKVNGWGQSNISSSGDRPHLQLRRAIDNLNGGMAGYVLSEEVLMQSLDDLKAAVTNPALPVFEIDEQLSVLSGRIPGDLFDKISDMLTDFRKKCDTNVGNDASLRFPSESVEEILRVHADGIDDLSEKAAFKMLTTPLSEAVSPYANSKDASIPGSERALNCFLRMLRDWIFVERWFYETLSYADAVDKLRKTEKSNYDSLLDVCRAHSQLESTSKIVKVIIGIIGVALTGTASSGKQVSLLTGANSLEATIPCLSEIGSMRCNDAYADVALAARKLLLMESMPSLEDLKAKTWDAVQKLSKGTSKSTDDLITDHLPLVDVLHPLLSAHPSKDDQLALLELYSRYLYRTNTFKDVEKITENALIKFTFSNSASEGVFNNKESITSMTDLTRLVSSGSLTNLAELSESGSESNLQSQDKEDSIPPQTARTGVTVLLEKIDDISETSKFEAILSKFPQFGDTSVKGNSGPVNVLYFVVTNDTITDDATEESAGKRCEAILAGCSNLLEKADVRRVTFICNRENPDDAADENVSPAIFTYGHRRQFKEDSLFRHLEPNLAYYLDLPRISANFSLKALTSRSTTDCHVHVYKVTPKQAALSKDPKASKAARIYGRAISVLREFSLSSFERTLVDALNAIDLHSLESKSDNHLFINFLGDVENTVLDPVEVERAVGDILKSHGERVSSLGIAEVETRLVCSLQKDSPPIALRLVASNPTGYVQVMNTYVEASGEAGNEKTFKLIGGTKGSLAGTGDSSWEGLEVSTPYRLTRPFDAQRKYALRASDTVYCYDLPALFEAAVEEHWMGLSAKGGSKAESELTTSTIAAMRSNITSETRRAEVRAAGQPGMVMYTTELVVQKKSSATSSGTWTMQDYLNGDLQLTEMNRGAGANDVGMVAWIMTLKTYEYPAGRQLVLIANDITHKAGSFGTREDVVFKLASEYAREKCIPRLYVAANSGARIGVAEGVRKAFKVAFKDPSKPENGFDFLYVTKDDYTRLGSAHNEIIAEPVSLNGEEVYRITDIIGSEPDLGVENLKGSGLIAGETSAAYEEIFTMTIVLGRTVGIGAYLVRLGQRTIQKKSDSPIILTGYQALNKLMGVDVYSTNDQLGGPGIMYPNGVSHMVEPDHLSAVKAAVQWLSYVPSARGNLLPITDVRGFDSIERTIDFSPSPGTPYDPRALLEGMKDDDGKWLSGFFDKGSFTETLSGWAQTVIGGRARLGGIPMGVVITENRTAEAIKPADPADVKASEAVIQQAGCVWFPNSAYKTAQAIRDFRTEDLPLIVFANWRGFSGGQRDMFDEVLKYGSMIVDAFVSYEQPVFVFIPPFAEIRGGAWVVLDASINASVMEMYATAGSARGGVLEANGAASVKYRTKDLLKTMHRLDDTLKALDAKLDGDLPSAEIESIKKEISKRESSLLPVYEQISVQFCELHDTPGRMEAVGVIEKQVEWKQARSFFYWRLRRKLAEFDLRKKIVSASNVGHGVKSLTPLEASSLIKNWCTTMGNNKAEAWDNDQAFLTWMADHYQELEGKVQQYEKECIVQEVYQVMSSVGSGADTGAVGVVEGLSRALKEMKSDEQNNFKKMLKDALQF